MIRVLFAVVPTIRNMVFVGKFKKQIAYISSGFIFAFFVMMVIAFGFSNYFSKDKNFALTLSGTYIPTYSAYGRALAAIIDKSVKDVHSNIPDALVTHDDMLEMMCLELGDRYLNKVARGNLNKNNWGDYGIAQFQPKTFVRVVKEYGLFPLPDNKSELINMMNDPKKALLASAYYKDELLRICKKRGFTGRALRNCASVAYNGGEKKIDAMPRDGSPPGYCYCTQSTKNLKICKGKPILAKHQRNGKMHCITRRYGYDGLNKCIAEIKRGGGSKLKSSLWRSLIASTNKLKSGQTIASYEFDDNLFSSPSLIEIAQRAKDFGNDIWNRQVSDDVEPWQLSEIKVSAPYDYGDPIDALLISPYFEEIEETDIEDEIFTAIQDNGNIMYYAYIPTSYLADWPEENDTVVYSVQDLVQDEAFVPVSYVTILEI